MEKIKYGEIQSDILQRVKEETLYDAERGSKKMKYEEFSENTLEEKDQHDKMLQLVENKRKMRSMAVPTNDRQIMKHLRQLGEPIFYFGEKPEDRRDRLREVLLKLGEDGTGSIIKDEPKGIKTEEKPKERTEVYYTKGSEELRIARLNILHFSFPHSKQRLQQVQAQNTISHYEQLHATLETMSHQFEHFSPAVSQLGDDRSLQSCRFSPCGKSLATCSWTGHSRLWSSSDCSLLHTFQGHSDRVNDISFAPNSSLLATCSADATICLYPVSNEEQTVAPLHTLTGHTGRVNKLAFHPSSRYLASTSHDTTFRLWDIEACSDLLVQEGHSRPVYAIGIHPDGSLLASGGLDTFGRLWDLRSGKCIWILQGHSKGILGIDFAPNGYQLSTCSEDHTVKVWDIRKREEFKTISAHNNIVTSVQYHPSYSQILFTASFDKTIKIWREKTNKYSLVATLIGHEAKISAIDFKNESLLSASHDRTFKICKYDNV